ncbi:glycoside hydrolase, family 18 [Coniella lustricola]|uniref:chitinase n=1 Tax=Coniella lustricola TaxID=2025994 RepID=A0A2T3A8S7_9PEZI|nr:glycoside hydrolase, family 18 [Coniella lustricola]
MVQISTLFSGLAAASTASAAFRNVIYFDQYHTAVLPNNSLTNGVTHVITAFANSSYFVGGSTMGDYTPFLPLDEVRALFSNGTKVCMAIGGWGDLDGFRAGALSNASRSAYASNVASTLTRLGYDCIDVDWEYPGGNGYDYKQVPNSDLTAELNTYPLLLGAIKAAIGSSKELSIAVPGLERDMIAFTADTVPSINAAVDFVNVMTYDLMNRRDTATKHHTDVNGSLATVEAYIANGMDPAKMNLGLAFYAKYFTLAANTTCTDGPIGCPIALAEDAEGQDTGASGAQTFEQSSLPVEVSSASLVATTDGTCGAANSFTCTGASFGGCCSQYGYCGATSVYCDTGCQSAYGTCSTTATKSVAESFADALTNGTEDVLRGGQWWVDDEAGLFWTWDTASIIARKFTDIIEAKGLGGIMAWSLAEDSYNWSHLEAMQEGVANLAANMTTALKRRQ